MNVLFSSNCISQLKIINNIAQTSNNDFKTLKSRILICLKSIENISKLEDTPLKLRKHLNSDRIGFLNGSLENCLSINIDYSNRLVATPKSDNAFIITSLGHYGIFTNSNDYKNIYKQYSQLDKITLNSKEFLLIDTQGKHIIKSIFGGNYSLKLTRSIINDFNNSMYDDVCPYSPNILTERLKYKIKMNGNLDTDKVIVDYLSNNTDLIQRIAINSRAISNYTTQELSNPNINEILHKKIQIDKQLNKTYSEFFLFCNKNIKSKVLKIQAFNICSKAFIEGFTRDNDNKVSILSHSPREYYENINQMDRILCECFTLDLNKIIHIEQSNDVIEKFSERELFKNTSEHYLDAFKIEKSRERMNQILDTLGVKRSPLDSKNNQLKKEVSKIKR